MKETIQRPSAAKLVLGNPIEYMMSNIFRIRSCREAYELQTRTEEERILMK